MIKILNLEAVKAKTKREIQRRAKAAATSIVRSGQTIENEIIVTILSGQSPVKGKQFSQYSKKYADRFKGGSRKPVNMKLTGEMLDSLTVRKTRANEVIIEFKSKIAVFHDKLGAGASKIIRRLLPDPGKGETFKSNIMKEIIKAARRGFKGK